MRRRLRFAGTTLRVRRRPQPVTARARGKLLVLLCVSLALWPIGRGISQMTEGRRTSMASRPLPPGVKPPEIRVEDVAVKAGVFRSWRRA